MWKQLRVQGAVGEANGTWIHLHPCLWRQKWGAHPGTGDCGLRGCGESKHGLSHLSGGGLSLDALQRTAGVVVPESATRCDQASVAVFQPELPVRGVVRRSE